MFGVLNIYKPKGITSHDVVNVVRKILGIKQVGHTGTLDPFAEGVLPVCVGKATRLIEYFDDEKTYVATVQFGTATDTYDIEGSIVKTSEVKINEERLISELNNFKGEIYQYPPKFSAIKINGKKLYEYARNGETVEIKPRKVFINKIELVKFNEKTQSAQILIECSKGTYIRSIANDLGENLGCYAHLSALIRTKAGKFISEYSIHLPINIIENNNTQGENSSNNKYLKYEILPDAYDKLVSALQSPTEAMTIPIVILSDQEHETIIHGNPIKKDLEKIKSDDFLILVYNNCIEAIGQYNGKEIKIKKVFV